MVAPATMEQQKPVAGPATERETGGSRGTSRSGEDGGREEDGNRPCEVCVCCGVETNGMVQCVWGLSRGNGLSGLWEGRQPATAGPASSTIKNENGSTDGPPSLLRPVHRAAAWRAGRRRLWAGGPHVRAAVHSSSLVRASLATFIAAAVETRALDSMSSRMKVSSLVSVMLGMTTT